MYHERLKVWQLSCELAVQICEQSNSMKNFGFRDQITRSSISVPSNIAEGMEKPTVKDKRKYLYIAKGSLAELKTQIIIGQRTGYLTGDFASERRIEAENIDFMLNRLIGSLD